MTRAAFFVFVLATALSGFLLFSSPTAHALPPGFTNELITENLSLPTDFALLPDGRILVAEKNGEVRLIKDDALLPSPALSLGVSTGGERGLMSIAADPDFAENRFIYLLYTSPRDHQRVSRFRVSGDAIDPTSEVILLENSSVWSGFLNAGAVRVGPDRKVYATFGSNGIGANAQNLSTLDGKMIRINRDGSTAGDNPFVATPGAHPAIYAYGFRNPFRFNFFWTGKPIVGDVGESQYEKIVRVDAPGQNFGWPHVEGDCRPDCGSVTPPLFVIPHDGGHASVTGGDIVKDDRMPGGGTYIFGDFVRGTLRRMSFDGTNLAYVSDFDSGNGSLVSINYGSGCMHYLTIFPGELHRICAGNSVTPPPPPPPPGPLEITSSATIVRTTFASGEETARITGTVRANAEMKDVMIDLELWNANGKFEQKVEPKVEEIQFPTTLRPNESFTISFDSVLVPPGTYTVKIGVFSPDWRTLHHWNGSAAAFTVGPTITPPPSPTPTPPAPPSPTFALSTAMLNANFTAGATTTIRSQVTAGADLPNVLVDTEIYDASGTKVDQNFAVIPTGFRSNQLTVHDWHLSLPTMPGTYRVKVGIFSGDWSRLHFWEDNAFTFTIGKGPEEPAPGQTYPITLLVPSDSEAVSGVVEVKAMISGLNLSSYTIGWRTDPNGVYNALNPDPVSGNFHHAWIDFDSWNWIASQNYPLEFRATGRGGDIIGSKAITVHVSH